MKPATVAPNFTIVTLGVSDLSRSVSFYTALGWEKRGDEKNGICWFKTAATWLGLFPSAELAADAKLPATAALPAYRGVTLAINMNGVAEVDAAFAHVRSLGAAILKPPSKTEWGGYSGYFADPDGHVWEIAHAPMFPVDEHGHIEIR